MEVIWTAFACQVPHCVQREIDAPCAQDKDNVTQSRTAFYTNSERDEVNGDIFINTPEKSQAQSLPSFVRLRGNFENEATSAEGSDIQVPLKTMIAFSPYFEGLFRSSMREMQDLVIKLPQFRRSTLLLMTEFSRTGIVPTSEGVHDLCQLYLLAMYLLQEHMEREVANAILKRASREELFLAIEFAKEVSLNSVRCILYDKLLHFFAKTCITKSWFVETFAQLSVDKDNLNQRKPNGLSLGVIKDLLNRDDLWVASENDVVALIDAWMSVNPGDNTEELIEVVRCGWLTKEERTRFFDRFLPIKFDKNDGIQSHLKYPENHPQISGGNAIKLQGENCKARDRYLQHVHYVMYETLVKKLERNELYEETCNGSLRLPRLRAPSKFTNVVSLMCACDGRPLTTLYNQTLESTSDQRLVIKSPINLVYYDVFTKPSSAIAYMKLPLGLFKFCLYPSPRCDPIPLDSLFEFDISFVVLEDICATESGLLLYLTYQESQRAVLLPKDIDTAVPVRSLVTGELTVDRILPRPRLQVVDDHTVRIISLSTAQCHTVSLPADTSGKLRFLQTALRKTEAFDNAYVVEDLFDLAQRAYASVRPSACSTCCYAHEKFYSLEDRSMATQSEGAMAHPVAVPQENSKSNTAVNALRSADKVSALLSQNATREPTSENATEIFTASRRTPGSIVLRTVTNQTASSCLMTSLGRTIMTQHSLQDLSLARAGEVMQTTKPAAAADKERRHFMLRASNRLEFIQPRATDISLFFPQAVGQKNLLISDGSAMNEVVRFRAHSNRTIVGFLPRRSFTIASICEYLPCMENT